MKTPWEEHQERRAAVMEPVAVALVDGLGMWRDKTARLMRAGFIPFPRDRKVIAYLLVDQSPEIDVYSIIEIALKTP